MILDVNSPFQGDSLDRTDPEGSYNAKYFKQVFGVIEGFKNYPNTLAFFSGNEVINEQSSKKVPAYIRVCRSQSLSSPSMFLENHKLTNHRLSNAT